MSRISSLYFNYLRNEAHYEFLFVVFCLLENFPEVYHLVEPLMDEFRQLLDLEKRLLDSARSSAYTQQIAEADHRIDRVISGIKATIKAAMFSFDDSVVEAARVLQLRIKVFGSMQKRAYEEESAAVQVLLSDLTGKFASQVTLLGLQTWVGRLSTEEAAFTALYMNRNVEMAERPQERFITVRHQIESVYHGIIELITATALTDPRAEYNEFIAQINVQIKYFNEHSHHHARKDISVGNHCVIEAIETQTYTGSAIIPIPKVYYREEGKPSLELVFAVDFFVTYKNNVDVGMAKCIVHGKGAYNGQVTVTFVIS
jgi:hypothetical protein